MADLFNVHDFYFPSPPPLKELASIEIALNLWRREIQQHLTENGTLGERHPPKKASLRSLFTDLQVPAANEKMIEEYVIKLESSIPDWLSYHAEKGIFKPEDILKHFLDFICDFDGSIHYGKTAKRFAACKEIDYDTRFKMACEYCLEYEILNILPKIGRRMRLEDANLNQNPKLFYWLSRLKLHLGQMDRLIRENKNTEASTLEEYVLDNVYLNEDFDEREWSSVEYFLNRVSANKRKKALVTMRTLGYIKNTKYNPNLRKIFHRHVMARLNTKDLKEVVTERGEEVIIFADRKYVLRVWDYIKVHMTNLRFSRLASYIFRDQADNSSPTDDSPYWRELWTSAPDRLKRAAIRDILPKIDSSYFDRQYFDGRLFFGAGERRSVSFLAAMLSYAPVKDRRTFWEQHWEVIIYGLRPDDLDLLLNLCYDDETQKTQFKKDLVFKHYKKVKPHLKNVFTDGCLLELEDFLKVIRTSGQNVRKIWTKLLQSEDFQYCCECTRDASSLNEFIDKAFKDPELSAKFKNGILQADSDLKILLMLKTRLGNAWFRFVMDFVEIFAPSEMIKQNIKRHWLIPALLMEFKEDIDIFRGDLDQHFEEFEEFIKWLFKNPDEMSLLRGGLLDVDEIFQKLLERKTFFVEDGRKNGVDYDWFQHCFQTLEMPDSVFVKFLKWYFVTPEAVEEFERKYNHDPMFNRLLLGTRDGEV